MAKKIKVFVTYSWDDENHKTKVISFTNFLRQNGFDADLDRGITQNESAADFGKMMHSHITDSDKVIVVLSKNYKKKAEAFKGGVGKEYRYIISDIDKNPDKYVLVSFEKNSSRIRRSIAPMEFSSREIVNLYNDESKNFNKLFGKLMSEKEVELDEVTNQLPNIEIEKIPVFTLIGKELKSEIADLNELTNTLFQRIGQDSYFEEYITSITCRHAIINKKLVIKKEVDTKIILKNPVDNFIEEANFFTPYKFSTIDGIEDKDLLKLEKLKIKVDNAKLKDISESILIKIDYDGDSKIYDDCVKFQYQKVEENHAKSLIVPFENKLILHLKEERIVPRHDTIYSKKINKLTKKFELSYSFEDFDGTIIGNCFSSISEKDDISFDRDGNNSLKISTNNWLLPGDGIFILLK